MIKVNVIIFFIFLLIYDFSSAVEKIDIEISVDTAYLPYKSIEARDVNIAQDCSYPENNLIEVIRPAILNKKDGLIMLSNNPPPNRGFNSMFTPRTFPDFEVTDDDPIKHVITIWKSYTFIGDSSTYIIGVCHNDDSIYAFKLFVDTDSIEYKPLYGKEFSDENPLIPYAHVLYVGDCDRDGSKEIFLHVYDQRNFRKLFCIDFITLEIKWVNEVSSGIKPIYFQVYEHHSNSKILFTTGNSANGFKDSIYNDYYSYFTILDTKGNFLVNTLSSHYGHREPALIKSENVGEYFITHYLDFEYSDSTISKSSDEYLLSRIDVQGNILGSTNIKSTPLHMWLMRYGNNNELRLFVLFSKKNIEIYDCNLNLINETDPLEFTMNYYGRYSITGEKDSVYVFTDGLYDKNLKKLLQFPFNGGSFAPMEYDTLGNLTAYIITEHLHFYIGYIKKKTSFELTTVFYHRNQDYVLMALSGLMVGLIVVNFYRTRTKKNLSIISKQKRELESTHEALHKAQATIVAQEKFRQAKDIAGGFAHEIRNALSPARSALNKLIFSPKKDSDKMLSLANFSDRAIERAVDLTQLITQYTRLDSQRKTEVVNINDVINNVIEVNQFVIAEKKIRLKNNDKVDVIITGNKDQLFMVFNNLVLNAIAALENVKSPEIIIEKRISNDILTISIADNGCGIPDENIDKIFDVFFSTKPSTGTGIGLAMVKKILEMYDSSIIVRSREKKGSIFSVTMKISSGDLESHG